MSQRKKSSGAGFLVKLGLAALAALAASAIFRKKVLAPSPGNDYRLPSTPPANPSAAMGPEEATPLTEQEKQALASAMGIRTQGGAAVAEADSGSVDTASATDEADDLLVDDVIIDTIDADAETGAIVETIIDDTMITDEASGLIVEEITTETIVSDPDTGEILSDDSSTETILTDATTGDVLVDEIDLGDDGEESGEGAEGDDDGPEAMGIAAVPPIDALNAGDTSYWPAEGDHNCPDEFPVKGNASSRIYHLPGESSYDATIPEICFVSAEAAEAMGFRARKR